MSQNEVKAYYSKIKDTDIGQVARELIGDRITQEAPHLLECDCPNHASISKSSLHIMLDKNAWYCHGCSVGGDVLQLVEFIQTGGITKGQKGEMPESHREARRYLAEKQGLGAFPSERAESAPDGCDPDARAKTAKALMATTDYYHYRLLRNPEALKWLREKYGVSMETIKELKIGYADNGADPGKGILHVTHALTQEPHHFTVKELVGTGAFTRSATNHLFPFYKNRIMYPYWRKGGVVSLIGRNTPWSPDNKYEKAKYKKLLVSSEKRPDVCKSIANDYLYNEDVLDTHPSRVIITEGVTDCISLMEKGFPVISPVTTRIRNADYERILQRVKGVREIFICQDNEISQAGIKGALETARRLGGQCKVKIVTLPLAPKQEQARKRLRDEFNITIENTAKERKGLIDYLPSDKKEEVNALLADAKIDVNEYFANGHMPDDFESLLKAAVTPLEFAINQLDPEADFEKKTNQLRTIFEEMANYESFMHPPLIAKIQAVYGKSNMTVITIRNGIQEMVRAKKAKEKAKKKKGVIKVESKEGSCKHALESGLEKHQAETGYIDYAQGAKAVVEWFKKDGLLFKTKDEGEPVIYFKGKMIYLDSSDRNRKRAFQSLIFELTDISPMTNYGKVFYHTLGLLVHQIGEERDQLSWLDSDVAERTVHFNLNNEKNEIVKISPKGAIVMPNGASKKGILLTNSRKMMPIQYDPKVDPKEAERLLKELVLDNLTCSSEDKQMIVDWLSCFLLLDFAGTKPHVRFEGGTGSGKTEAAKMVTTLLYGDSQQKISTTAANYSDGATNPLVSLDNLEANQFSEDLKNFLLTAVCGIVKEKRETGSDRGVVQEKVKCLVNSTGIEPLGGSWLEVMNRSLVFKFDRKQYGRKGYIGPEAIAMLKKHRNTILSGIINKAVKVLQLIDGGGHRKVKLMLDECLGEHPKDRLNEYYSLMYMMRFAEHTEREEAMETLDLAFVESLLKINETTDKISEDSDPINSTMTALFNAYRNAHHTDEEHPSARHQKSAFLEKYQVRFSDVDHLKDLTGGELFLALKRVAKEFNLEFDYKSHQAFSSRFCDALEKKTLNRFEISKRMAGGRRGYYDIKLSRC